MQTTITANNLSLLLFVYESGAILMTMNISYLICFQLIHEKIFTLIKIENLLIQNRDFNVDTMPTKR